MAIGVGRQGSPGPGECAGSVQAQMAAPGRRPNEWCRRIPTDPLFVAQLAGWIRGQTILSAPVHIYLFQNGVDHGSTGYMAIPEAHSIGKAKCPSGLCIPAAQSG